MDVLEHKRRIGNNDIDCLIQRIRRAGDTMSGALKDLFDRTYYQLLDTTAGKPYALAIRAGSDGTGTRRSVEAILTGLAWKAALPAEIFCGSFDSHFTERAREYAQTFAVGLECGIF